MRIIISHTICLRLNEHVSNVLRIFSSNKTKVEVNWQHIKQQTLFCYTFVGEISVITQTRWFHLYYVIGNNPAAIHVSHSSFSTI